MAIPLTVFICATQSTDALRAAKQVLRQCLQHCGDTGAVRIVDLERFQARSTLSDVMLVWCELGQCPQAECVPHSGQVARMFVYRNEDGLEAIRAGLASGEWDAMGTADGVVQPILDMVLERVLEPATE